MALEKAMVTSDIGWAKELMIDVDSIIERYEKGSQIKGVIVL